MRTLRIDLADRSYDILIGRNLLAGVGQFIPESIQARRAVIVSNPSVYKLYGAAVSAGLASHALQTHVVEIPEGEIHKTLKSAEHLYDRLIEERCDRQTLLVALGGGVIGDLTGFVAATYQRGVPYIQIPTTLLSQVDSSVGGKTAVNHPRGKNLIGAFYQPRVVVIDIDCLKSLPPEEFRAGLAEVIKYGVIADPELFAYLETHAEKILEQDTECLTHIIETSCAIKAGVVERDETESNYRMILNFGHTIGHAIEALTSYSKFKHGEAIAIGMVYAAKLSRQMGKCSAEVVARIQALVKRLGLPHQLPEFPSQDYIDTMRLDKKARDNKIKFILARAIGSVEIVDSIPEPEFHKVLHPPGKARS